MRARFIAGLLLCAAPVAASGQSLLQNEILSSIVVRPVATAHPVAMADGRVHLAYELLLSNASGNFVTIRKVEALGPDGRVLRAIEGEHLAAMTMQYAVKPPLLGGGETAIVLMDVSFPAGAAIPATLDTRITATRQIVGPDGKPAPFPAGQPVPGDFSFTGGSVAVGKPARVIDAPLRGSRWLMSNGCCDRITPHRGAMITVNGTIDAPERFARDIVRLDAKDRASEGNYADLKSWPYYGTTIHSVADGTVVNVYDEAPEQVPGPTPTGITMQNIGGNMMVIDIGGGAFAFYAHLQRGSLRFKLGDRVRTGEVLGLLGNTGNSTAPHLHFHLMDGKSPLYASGIPFVFRSYTGIGVVPAGGEDVLDTGGAATVKRELLGPQRDTMPVDNMLVDFPER